MKIRKWLIAISCVYLVIGLMLISFLFENNKPQDADLVAMNQIVRQTALQWSGHSFQKPSESSYEYTVIDLDGTLLFQTSGQVPVHVSDAIRFHHTVMDVVLNETIVGKVIFLSNQQDLWQQQQKKLIYLFITAFLFFLLSALCYHAYLERVIVSPFKSLQSFARHVAMGDLDAPLPMDKGHSFGAFTESFDIMREQLAVSRKKETEANQSKKELVASLSHDIKTPVTSVKLISELLLVTEDRDYVREKLQTIYNKSEQIDLLITDMLHSSLEDLGEFKIHVSEESSQILVAMIQQADLYHQVNMDPIPGCLLVLDPLRTEQVIDNIISNSYKYAGTSITLSSEIIDGFLRLEFRDYGPGVPDEDLPKLFQKFFRGTSSTALSKQGSGLGLYIARHLVTGMNGDIQYYNRPDGFSVEILLPLAG